MLMADVLAVFFVVVGLLLAHVGVWLLCRGLWPAHVERSERQLSWWMVLAGIPPAGFAVLAVGVFAHVGGGPGKALAAVVASAFLLFAHSGLAGAVASIGRRLGAPDDTAWRASFRGGAALALAYAFPILGWFVILPCSVLLGAGASTVALVRGLFVAERPREAVAA